MNNNSYTSIIIDDEANAIELLKDIISNVNSRIKVKDTCTSWKKALELLQTNSYDIVFLDISMQGKNGMDLLKYNPNLNCEVIFITAHANHALEAFKFNTSGYLLKPINEIDLVQVLEKTLARIKNKRSNSQFILDSKIGIPDHNSINYVALMDIFYLEACNSYTKVYTKSENLLSSYNLGKFNELISTPLFFQVHRSFIVNLNFVSRYDHSGFVVMEDKKQIPVSKSMREEFLLHFDIITNKNKYAR